MTQPYWTEPAFLKVLNGPATNTHQMMVRLMIRLYPHCAVVQTHLPQHTAVEECLDVLINRSQRNGWNLSPYLPINYLWAGMTR